MRKLFVAVLVLMLAVPVFAKDKKPKTDKTAEQTVLLSAVVEQVEKALDLYQTDPEIGKVLPPLASADFDFKTVVDTKAGFGISFLIFKIGYNVDKQVINDVVFHYEPKPRPGFAREENFQKQLLDTIKAAAAAVKAQANANPNDPLGLTQLAVTVSFGVTQGGTVGGSAPINIVTITGSLERDKNTVHQVKLTFGPRKKP
jgi:hypothetical protein